MLEQLSHVLVCLLLSVLCMCMCFGRYVLSVLSVLMFVLCVTISISVGGKCQATQNNASLPFLHCHRHRGGKAHLRLLYAKGVSEEACIHTGVGNARVGDGGSACGEESQKEVFQCCCCGVVL